MSDSDNSERKVKKIKKDKAYRKQLVSSKPSYSTQNKYNKEIVLEDTPEKTHISCRRCKQITFSLKTRTCSKCNYPKEERPAYFPTTKHVQVVDLVRQGKLVHNSYTPAMIFGKKQRIKCHPSDSIFDFKKLISAQTGNRPQKIRLQKANIIYKDHLHLEDYEIKDGMGLQMYYD